MIPVIFVAGPFNADSDLRRAGYINHARMASLALWKMGYAVISPHMNSGMLFGEAEEGIFLAGYLEMVRRADALFFLAESPGANDERALAIELGKPVFRTYLDAQNWISDPQ